MKKFLEKLAIALIVTVFFSCGSTEKVVTQQGEVFEVKGDKVFNEGKEVTSEISSYQGQEILNLKEQNDELERRFSKKQDEIEKAIVRQKEIQKEARERENVLDGKLRKLKEQVETRERAKQDYIQLNEKYNNEASKYENLKDEGKLEPEDITQWENKLNELNNELEAAKIRYNKLRDLEL